MPGGTGNEKSRSRPKIKAVKKLKRDNVTDSSVDNSSSTSSASANVPQSIRTEEPESSSPKLARHSVSASPEPSLSDGVEILDISKDVSMREKSTSLSSTANIPLMWTMEETFCQFCCIEMPERQGVLLSNCLHTLCKNCLASTIEQQKNSQIKCPLFHECFGFLLDQEIRALLTPDAYTKYLERSLQEAKAAMNIFECKTPNCDGWCEFEDGRKIFVCYKCSKSNCLECKAVHEGVDCQTFQRFSQNGASQASVDDLINKERKDGWEQLKRLIQPSSTTTSGELGRALSQLEDTGVFYSTEEFECIICFTEVKIGDGIIFQDCLHMFCRDCAMEHIKACDEPEVKCPYMDANYSCTNTLKPREIKALVPADEFEKHLERSVKLAESSISNSFHCKTPDCLGWCEIVEDGGATVFRCYLCDKDNCLKCKAIHDGTCEDYQNRQVQDKNVALTEKALQKMISSGECMVCPKCQTHVQKLSGCDWLVCLKCKTELCWATKGPRWGPKGRGDTSGGCKCDFRARKPCTKTCQNCH